MHFTALMEYEIEELGLKQILLYPASWNGEGYVLADFFLRNMLALPIFKERLQLLKFENRKKVKL